jgi:hypothetical protein
MADRGKPRRVVGLILMAASVVLVVALAVTHSQEPRTCFQSGVYDYNVPVANPVGIYTLSDGTTYTGTDPPPECSLEARTSRAPLP